MQYSKKTGWNLVLLHAPNISEFQWLFRDRMAEIVWLILCVSYSSRQLRSTKVQTLGTESASKVCMS